MVHSHPPELGKFVYHILSIQKQLQNAVSGSLMLLDPKESFISGVEIPAFALPPYMWKNLSMGLASHLVWGPRIN